MEWFTHSQFSWGEAASPLARSPGSGVAEQ